MDFDTTDLLDCGHVGHISGICQWAEDNAQGCADRLCDQCLAACVTCQSVLCPRHQIRLESSGRVYCKAHLSGYIARTLLDRFLDR